MLISSNEKRKMNLKAFLYKHPRLQAIWGKIALWFSDIQWPRLQAFINTKAARGIYYRMQEQDHDQIRKLLKENYFIVLTRRRCHLTSYLISLVSKLATGTSSHWTHALMNVEDDLEGHLGYMLVEATKQGVHPSSFMQVFDCDSVVLLKPVGCTLEEWTQAMDECKKAIGKQYDTLFDILDDNKVSCVELVYVALMRIPNAKARFPKLLALIESKHNELTPQMLYDCGDLEIVYEQRR